MTREQAINYLISSGFSDEQVSEVVRALTYEPTTKNNLGVDCISRADAIKAMQDKAKKLTNEDTINGLCGAVAILFDLPSVTTKNDSGVDLISRPDAINAVSEALKHTFVEHEDIANKIIGNLPSVTPQEPILDKIYADIQKLRGCSCSCSDGIIDDVEDILDKYKAESEVNNG